MPKFDWVLDSATWDFGSLRQYLTSKPKLSKYSLLFSALGIKLKCCHCDEGKYFKKIYHNQRFKRGNA